MAASTTYKWPLAPCGVTLRSITIPHDPATMKAAWYKFQEDLHANLSKLYRACRHATEEEEPKHVRIAEDWIEFFRAAARMSEDPSLDLKALEQQFAHRIRYMKDQVKDWYAVREKQRAKSESGSFKTCEDHSRTATVPSRHKKKCGARPTMSKSDLQRRRADSPEVLHTEDFVLMGKEVRKRNCKPSLKTDRSVLSSSKAAALVRGETDNTAAGHTLAKDTETSPVLSKNSGSETLVDDRAVEPAVQSADQPADQPIPCPNELAVEDALGNPEDFLRTLENQLLFRRFRDTVSEEDSEPDDELDSASESTVNECSSVTPVQDPLDDALVVLLEALAIQDSSMETQDEARGIIQQSSEDMNGVKVTESSSSYRISLDSGNNTVSALPSSQGPTSDEMEDVNENVSSAGHSQNNVVPQQVDVMNGIEAGVVDEKAEDMDLEISPADAPMTDGQGSFVDEQQACAATSSPETTMLDAPTWSTSQANQQTAAQTASLDLTMGDTATIASSATSQSNIALNIVSDTEMGDASTNFDSKSKGKAAVRMSSFVTKTRSSPASSSPGPSQMPSMPATTNVNPGGLKTSAVQGQPHTPTTLSTLPPPSPALDPRKAIHTQKIGLQGIQYNPLSLNTASNTGSADGSSSDSRAQDALFAYNNWTADQTIYAPDGKITGLWGKAHYKKLANPLLEQSSSLPQASSLGQAMSQGQAPPSAQSHSPTQGPPAAQPAPLPPQSSLSPLRKLLYSHDKSDNAPGILAANPTLTPPSASSSGPKAGSEQEKLLSTLPFAAHDPNKREIKKPASFKQKVQKHGNVPAGFDSSSTPATTLSTYAVDPAKSSSEGSFAKPAGHHVTREASISDLSTAGPHAQLQSPPVQITTGVPPPEIGRLRHYLPEDEKVIKWILIRCYLKGHRPFEAYRRHNLDPSNTSRDSTGLTWCKKLFGDHLWVLDTERIDRGEVPSFTDEEIEKDLNGHSLRLKLKTIIQHCSRGGWLYLLEQGVLQHALRQMKGPGAAGAELRKIFQRAGWRDPNAPPSQAYREVVRVLDPDYPQGRQARINELDSRYPRLLRQVYDEVYAAKKVCPKVAFFEVKKTPAPAPATALSAAMGKPIMEVKKGSKRRAEGPLVREEGGGADAEHESKRRGR